MIYVVLVGLLGALFLGCQFVCRKLTVHSHRWQESSAPIYCDFASRECRICQCGALQWRYAGLDEWENPNDRQLRELERYLQRLEKEVHGAVIE